jgi:alkylation response protein AidB-like acyl-CoA dehydrogenase
MDFSFSEEEQMLEATTKRFVSSEYSFERRLEIARSEPGWSREVWARLAELGLLAAAIPEEDGGIDAGPVGTMLVSQVLGGALLLEPFHSSALVATRAIARIGSKEQRARLLPALSNGSRVAVLAHDEPHAVLDFTRLSTRARRVKKGYVLSGSKPTVYHAPMADLLLVSARLDDSTALFALPADLPDIGRREYRTVDGQRAADLSLEDVAVPADACLGSSIDAELLEVLDHGIAALCAEAVGTLTRALEATVEYSRTRTQFGVPIGSFQALQHRMADMLIQVEQARSMSYLATTRALDSDARSRRVAISGAKVSIGKAARRVGQEAVQLHGGMGVTDELDISHHFKRLLAFELRFGTTDEHLEVYRRAMVAEHLGRESNGLGPSVSP